MLYQSSPFCLCSSPSATSTRLDSSGSGSTTATCSVKLLFLPSTTVSVVFGCVYSALAAGGDCDCGAPQSEVTRPSRSSSESYVREKTVAPKTIQAADAHRKMNAMATMRFNIPFKSPPFRR
ncbi:MAG TPA: hypothetical protein VN282_27300 [Pyrinomonadaceae bacterium]|nr:hypothetical protein [Pyrinomonadaceae bacterium]